MTELSQALLSAARDGLGPDAATMARVRAKVAVAAAAPLVATSVSMPIATPASTPAAMKVPAIVASVSLVALVGVIATVVVVRSRAAGPNPSDIAIASRGDSEGLAPSNAVRATAHVAATTPGVPGHEATTSAAPEPPTLAREVELVDRAVLHLRRGAPREALADLVTYRHETHGRGQLAEDAAAVDIEARCRLDVDVTEILAAFDRRWPTSAQRARLADACRRR